MCCIRGNGGAGSSHPGVRSAMTRGVCFSCVFVNECAVMSVLAGPLFSMISEGSVHSSLVIGLRGGRFARPPWAATAPLWPQPTSNGFKLQINQLVISTTENGARSSLRCCFVSVTALRSSYSLEDRWCFSVDNAAGFSSLLCILRNNNWNHFCH